MTTIDDIVQAYNAQFAARNNNQEIGKIAYYLVSQYVYENRNLSINTLVDNIYLAFVAARKKIRQDLGSKLKNEELEWMRENLEEAVLDLLKFPARPTMRN
jgi:hypothetical protein